MCVASAVNSARGPAPPGYAHIGLRARVAAAQTAQPKHTHGARTGPMRISAYPGGIGMHRAGRRDFSIGTRASGAGAKSRPGRLLASACAPSRCGQMANGVDPGSQADLLPSFALRLFARSSFSLAWTVQSFVCLPTRRQHVHVLFRASIVHVLSLGCFPTTPHSLHVFCFLTAAINMRHTYMSLMHTCRHIRLRLQVLSAG